MSRECLVALLAGALCTAALTAGAAPRPAQAGDPKQREAALEQALDTLKGQCQKMLDQQITIRNATLALDKIIADLPGKQPRPQNRQAALRLAGDVEATVVVATRVIDRLEKDGSAVAFPEIFRQLRTDMQLLQYRLANGDVGSATQALQDDLIDTLMDMIRPIRG